MGLIFIETRKWVFFTPENIHALYLKNIVFCQLLSAVQRLDDFRQLNANFGTEFFYAAINTREPDQ